MNSIYRHPYVVMTDINFPTLDISSNACFRNMFPFGDMVSLDMASISNHMHCLCDASSLIHDLFWWKTLLSSGMDEWLIFHIFMLA